VLRGATSGGVAWAHYPFSQAGPPLAKAGLAAGGGAGCAAGAACAGAAQAGAFSGAAAGLGAGCEPHAGAAAAGALAVARCGRGVGAAGTLSPAMTLAYSGSLASSTRSILLVSELDLPRFCAAPLITYRAAKEMSHEHRQDG
jgi:hypothetical protein